MVLTKSQKKEAQKKLSMAPGPWQKLEIHDKVAKWITRAFVNNRYYVSITDNQKTTNGECIRVMVSRHDYMPIPRHWNEMQKIKNELFGEETLAIEYYPPESQVLDLTNIYWMCIFPKGVIPEIVL